jgi:hypothetical protein
MGQEGIAGEVEDCSENDTVTDGDNISEKCLSDKEYAKMYEKCLSDKEYTKMYKELLKEITWLKMSQTPL